MTAQAEQFYFPRFSLVERPNQWMASVEGVAKPPTLGGLEELYAAVADPGCSRAVRELCDWWNEDGGTMRFGPCSVSLDRKHPSKPSKPLSHFLVYSSGFCWLRRGYLLNNGAVPAQRVEEFDALVKRELPDLAWVGKGYELKCAHPLPLEGVKAVEEWLGRAGDEELVEGSEL